MEFQDRRPMKVVYGNAMGKSEAIYSVFTAVGIDGRPVERTKEQYPYSYDMFVVWRDGPNEDCTGSVYSDRMVQWDSNLYEECRKKHDLKNYVGATRQQLNGFMSDYLKKPVQVLFLAEGCNQSNGYPVWLLGFKEL